MNSPAGTQTLAEPRAARECGCPFAARRPYATRLFSSVDEIDAGAWDDVVGGGELFLQRRYLSALEQGGSDLGGFRYALFHRDDEPVGVARFHLTDFVGQPVESLLTRRSRLTRFMARRLRVDRGPLSVRLVLCGSPFSTGEHGFSFRREAAPERLVSSLVHAARTVQRQTSASDRASAILFKEFYPTSEPLFESLERCAYSPLPVEPTMLLPIDPAWRSFDDYLASLASKYRVKAKRTYKGSQQLVVRELSAHELVRRRPRLEQLYSAVVERADYRLGKLGVDTLVNLRRELDDELLVQGYYLGDELVGFMTGLADGDTLEAQLVGFDYGLNREHFIYPRMLYDYLRAALARGLRRVNYGRTAGEIKSTVGAVPVPLRCYVRHRGRVRNRFLPHILRSLRVPESPLRRPFKKTWYEMTDAFNIPELGLSGAPWA